jgi:hypothetical protein
VLKAFFASDGLVYLIGIAEGLWLDLSVLIGVLHIIIRRLLLLFDDLGNIDLLGGRARSASSQFAVMADSLGDAIWSL